MEEDIEILEEQLEQYKRHLENYEKENCLTSVYYELKKYAGALENLIKGYRELKNKKYIMSISCDGECNICEHYKNEYLLEIKIENKIEELKGKSKYCSSDELREYNHQIQVLEELLTPLKNV